MSGPVTLTNIALGSDKQNRPPSVPPVPQAFPTVEAWPEPVDGGLLLADMASTRLLHHITRFAYTDSQHPRYI
jgi:hypothetical protein